ncbi:M56 family metallopeptidase [Rubinisphaera brasiliensis]|uniref:Peptidase M56 BlaR1 n=1 Tax=Rubinisphaera brasiliensis (strain ATCC 49424 / DSM 5305 / JCM 21570 / IAM 15109 / NBRC 103401 / IFAM 1448) TaxID=756272 RepID=F0STK1_RUBBR|nr:M56 family metallopeptidase [Rubinisphaera brasiliensis]ADY61470.1 peptidase M56 BlaR1 [Rubinisphaera brasiliensis DSM 5305]
MSGLETSGMWFVSSAICGSALLLIGSLAACLAREPVYRIRIIQCTLLAALVAPVVQSSKILPDVDVWLGTRAAESGFAEEALTKPMSRLSSPSIVDGRSAERAGNESPNLPAETSARRTSAAAAGNASIEIAQQSTRSETGFLNAIDLLRAFQFAYLITVGVILILWGIAWRRRSRLAREASPASDELYQLLASVGNGRVAQTRLLVSKSISSPVMWGLVRPTIVLPAALVAQADPTALRWSLAHEWAHVVRGDFATLHLANLGKMVFFYQPLYWWLRCQLTLSQDFLADAFAARQTEAQEEYASFIVALAKSKRQIALTGTLGIGGRRSNLFRRVERLLNANCPPAEQIRRGPAVGIVAVTLFVAVAVSGVRLSAEPPTSEPVADQAASTEERNENSSDKDQANVPEPITYESQVVDRVTGKPITGATINIKQKLIKDPESGDWKTLRTTHTSDENGRFRFTLPAEELAEHYSFLDIEAFHPEYQPLGEWREWVSGIRENIGNGADPFDSVIKLWPGQPIITNVLEPDGTPSAGTRFIIHSKGPTKKRHYWEPDPFQDGTTDERGVLKAVVATPGDGVLWVCPKDFSPVAIRLGDERGNLDPIRLEQGTRISGRVLDREGNPVSGVAVNASDRSRYATMTGLYQWLNGVSSQIGAGTRTDSDGRFLLNPLPPGEYLLEVSELVRDPSSPPEQSIDEELDHVFVPLELTLEKGKEIEPVEIKAHPEVTVRGRFFDSHGNPSPPLFRQDLIGEINETVFITSSTKPEKDGWFEFRAPRGLEDTGIMLVLNENSVSRWRLKPGGPLESAVEPKLGTLDKDLTTIEIVHYDAPILTIKVIGEDGEQRRDVKIVAEYKKLSKGEVAAPEEPEGLYFERQSDGRYRSSQLLPDEEVKVTVEKDGYTTTPQTVKMKEGESQEIVFVLQKTQPQ